MNEYACFVKGAHSLLLIIWLLMCGFYFLKGLNSLQNLKELNLADNIIERIGRLESFFIFFAEFDCDFVSILKENT